MFSEDERAAVRDDLIAYARADERITAAALVGSLVRNAEDAWSDIDLMLRLAEDQTPEEIADDWTARMPVAHGAVAHTDVWAGPALYRVFLLDNSLQVDISFWPSDKFASTGPPIQLVFGAANDPTPTAPRDLGGSSARPGSTHCTCDRASRAAAACKRSTCSTQCAIRSSPWRASGSGFPQHTRAVPTTCPTRSGARSRAPSSGS